MRSIKYYVSDVVWPSNECNYFISFTDCYDQVWRQVWDDAYWHITDYVYDEIS